jgi:hypothetical protein
LDKPASFDDTWRAIRAEKKCSIQAAMKEAAQKHPQMHEAYLAALKPVKNS